MAGNGPRPCGRQSIACRLADPLWTTTVSGPPQVPPQAAASVSAKTMALRTTNKAFLLLIRLQPPISTALEIRVSDWPALRRETVFPPILRQMPMLHRFLPALRFEPCRILARPPDSRAHPVGRAR